MPDFYKSIKITQPTPGGPLVEQVVGAVQVSTGTAADAGKLVVLDATGTIDSSMISGGGGGGSASTLLYPDDTVHPISGYNLLTVDPSTPEKLDVSPALGAPSASPNFANLIDAPYVTLAGYPALTLLPAGTWMFNLYALTSDVTVLPVIDIVVYKISSPFTPGTEVRIFPASGAVTTPIITSTSVGLYTVTFTVTSPIALLETDQLVMHFYARATGGSNPAATVTFYHSGSTHASWISSPIPMVTSFSALSSGTNTEATMAVGGTASLAYTGTGVVNANEIGAINVAGNSPAHQGQLLISQPGNTTALWADPFVQGPWINGTAVVAPGAMGDGTSNIQPVWVAGYDGTNMRGLLTDSSGRLVVIGSLTHNNTAPTTGNIGVLPAVASSAVPTYNAGDQVLLSTDLSGQLRVTSAGSFTPALTADRLASGSIISTQNVSVSTAGGGAISIGVTGTWTGTLVFESSVDGTTWVSNAVSPVPFGNLTTSATANGSWLIAVGGLNSFRVRGNTVATGTAVITLEVGAGANAITISDIIQGSVSVSNFPATQTVSGNVTAAQGSPTTIGNSWPVEVTDGTNILLTTSHPGNINIAQVNGSTVAAAASGIIKIGVTDGAGTSILSTNDSSVIGLNVHVTNTGGLGGTQYVEGTNIGATGTGTLSIAKNPSNLAEALHVDASNNLLTNVNVALPTGTNTIGSVKITDGTNVLGTAAHPVITQDVSDGTPGIAVPATAMFMAGKDNATGFLHGLSTDSNGVLNVNASVSGSFTPALTADRTASGTLTTINGTVTLSTQGVSGVVFNIVNDTTAWTGTIVFEASPDGTNWYPVNAYAKFPSGAATQSTTANGQWSLPAGGLNSFRVRANTAITGGTGAKVWLEAGAGALIVEVAQTTAANLNATVTQGAANTASNGWPVKITDGTNILGTTGNPVVVNVNNTPTVTLGAGTNNIGYTSYQVPTLSRMTRAVINFSGSGANTLVAGVGGQTIRVWRIHFNCGGSTQITWLDGVTAMSGPFSYSTGGGEVLDFSGDPWYITSIGNDLKFNSSNAVQVGGTIWFTQS